VVLATSRQESFVGTEDKKVSRRESFVGAEDKKVMTES
jgi:hypothetical protein